MSAQPFRRTYVAAAVLLGLGAYFYFVESKREEKPEKPKQKVLVFDKSKARELTLTPSEGETIHVVKLEGAWRMEAPLLAPADGGEVDSLLSSLENLEIDEVASEGGGRLADFGLEKPKTAVGVRLEGASKPLELLLGDKTPDGSGVYAKLPTQPRVLSVASYVAGAFGKKPFDLRDRDVLHVKRDAIKSLEITGPDGSYALARSDKGDWAFTKPIATLAGRWSVDGLLGTLEGLRMESVAAEDAKDLKPFGLDKPARRVVLGLADGATKTLEVGSSPQEKKYHVRDASGRLVAVVAGGIVDDLAKGMKELRAKRLLEVATYEVVRFEVETPEGKRAYVRSSTKDPKEGFDVYKWKRTLPDGKDIDTNKVQDVLFKLGGMDVAEFVDAPEAPAAYGLDKPALKVTVHYEGKPDAWFGLVQKDGAGYASRAGDASVLKLDASKVEELLKAFREL